MRFNMAIGELNVQSGTRLHVRSTAQHDAVLGAHQREAPGQNVVITERREQLCLAIETPAGTVQGRMNGAALSPMEAQKRFAARAHRVRQKMRP